MKNITTELAALQAVHLYRTRQEVTEKADNSYTSNGAQCISFCHNDYLNLSQDARVIQAFKDGADQYGVGSGASAMISGYTYAHRQFEDAFADFMQCERALLFNNGYMANLGVMQALASRQSMIYQDKLNHASLIDAGRLSGASLKRYRHLDTAHLIQQVAKQKTDSDKLIVAEGVYSMEGALSPLPELVKIAHSQKARLIIDDAHGIGVLGEKGRGSLEHFGLTMNEVNLLICPLGKAFGAAGAIVCGSQSLIEFIMQKARTYIYTTMMPPAVACALSASLQIIQTEPWRRERVKENIIYFRQEAEKRQLLFEPSQTAIQTIIVGDSKRACDLSHCLLQQGLLVVAIRPPTVPKNTARLRMTLTCQHEKKHIDKLLDELQKQLT
ncbi:MAG: 8-amino-7-oxononanoate synthase [Legionellales bacterium]|nr:8-amino-7-oxononanoate synthase [Legionellales bacterium]